MSHTAVMERRTEATTNRAPWIELVAPEARDRRRFELFRQRIDLPDDSGPYRRVRTVPVSNPDVL